MDTHVLRIHVDEEKPDQIKSVDIYTEGRKNKIFARQFILAAGGIENPRMLLMSVSKAFPQGIGNQHDNVGRFYMSHLIGSYSAINPYNRENLLFDFEKDKEGVYCRRRWWISPKAQHEKQIGNIIMFLHRSMDAIGHRDPLFSGVFLAKEAMSIVHQKRLGLMYKRLKTSAPAIKEHLHTIVKEGPAMLPQVFKLAKMRFAKRRLPFILPDVNSSDLYLYYQSEHFPNPQSRITLSSETDALGLPLPVIDVQFQPLDIETVVAAHRMFAQQFTSKHLGEIRFDEAELRSYLQDKIINFNSAAHHLGTTRMAEDPAEGVVDANCQVHGVSNLYIAGSSVFATGGHANPTLTILALALKLADHLKKQF
ncbi:hypothetical protein HH214_00185 [Mucilaginibacter robiniae]|uniref:Glucose-methanol-choline oxidoreductase C-terminal domain-containing protein n=2 Tax=Mucilaginibacter robiniae TaxID=2728022 RepID=A0A7L5DTI2_9SPHI|nr:hypothetical protein HH214_00185 [Mucilaginibacter robiniae]